jgi:hypothetical protein
MVANNCGYRVLSFEGFGTMVVDRIRDLLLPIGGSVRERLNYLDVAGHSDKRVSLARLSEQFVGPLSITWGGAID